MKRSLPVLALVVIACSSENVTPPPVPGDLTYFKDVKPILDGRCAGCHFTGGIAPFPLKNFADAKAHLDQIRFSVMTKQMPPWPPSADCNEFYFKRALTEEQIATVIGWIDQGAPEGDPGQEGEAMAPIEPGMSRVDLTLAMPAEYTPVMSPDEYRCFLIPWPETETTYVTGFNARPGNTAVVHHIIPYVVAANRVAEYQALDDAEPGPGYTCFGGPGGDNTKPFSMLGGWAPGSMGSDMPPGTGLPITPGSVIVLQMHYNTATSAPAPDLTSIELKLDSTVSKPAAILPWTNPVWVLNPTSMQIPAGEPDVEHTYSDDPAGFLGFVTNGAISGDFVVYSGALHMHQLGTWGKLSLEHAGGDSECLLEIDDWNFHWQGSYGFTNPRLVKSGDRLSIDCHWDNAGSDAQDVSWGEGTGDEMCVGFFYITEP